MGSERREDADYNDHCPECDGTEFTYIDYDPDSAVGRKNRAKYCKPWDPVVSLDRIVASADEDGNMIESMIHERKI